jgi:hypothetical protein
MILISLLLNLEKNWQHVILVSSPVLTSPGTGRQLFHFSRPLSPACNSGYKTTRPASFTRKEEKRKEETVTCMDIYDLLTTCIVCASTAPPVHSIRTWFFLQGNSSFSTDDRAGSRRADGQLLGMSVQYACCTSSW